MSKNFFAALDDSGDEAPAPVKTVEKKQNKAKQNNKVAEPSRADPKRRPNQNDRNTKYGRGGRAPTRDGKRQYDRRSGTGRGREVKKGGGGARNWGSDKNEARQAQGHVEDEDAVGTPTDVVAPPKDDTEHNEGEEGGAGEGGEDGANAEEEQPEPEPEPEDLTISYEEYMANKTNPDNVAFAPVKERQIDNEFAGMKVSKKDAEEEFMGGGGKQKKNKQKKGRQEQSFDMNFRVASGDDYRRRDGGGRGGGRDGGRGRGRGGGRGRDGRGRDGRGRGRGGRGGRGGGRGLDVSDESAFPSLG